MHELAIGQGIVKAALDEMSRLKPAPRSLLKARVVIGQLHQIVTDSLLLAYEVLIRDTPAAGSRLEIEQVPITAQCKSCGWKGEIQQPFFMCPACNSGDIELMTGKELYLANLEIEQNDS